MTQISLPLGSSNSGTNDWADVYNNDAAITTVVNSQLQNENLAADAGIVDSKLASPNNSAYRTITSARGTIGHDFTAATFLLGSAGYNDNLSGITYPHMLVSGTAAFPAPDPGGAITHIPPTVFYFDNDDYTVAGKTQKLRLRCQVAANATAPGINFIFGLYPVTIAGGADVTTYTAGSVVASSTQAINAPSASTVTSAVNSDFTIPNDGAYVLAVVTSGAIANNSLVSCHAQLQTRSV